MRKYRRAVADPPLSALAYFSHRDFMFEVVRIERIDPSFRGFRLRIQEVHDGLLVNPRVVPRQKKSGADATVLSLVGESADTCPRIRPQESPERYR